MGLRVKVRLAIEPLDTLLAAPDLDLEDRVNAALFAAGFEAPVLLFIDDDGVAEFAAESPGDAMPDAEAIERELAVQLPTAEQVRLVALEEQTGVLEHLKRLARGTRGG